MEDGWFLFGVLCLILAAMTAGGILWQGGFNPAAADHDAAADRAPPVIACRLCDRPADPYTTNPNHPPLCAECLQTIIIGALERRASNVIDLPLDPTSEAKQICSLCNKSGHRRFYHLPEVAGPICGYCLNHRFHVRAS